ncbi:hypothetical protein PFHG_03457 [Plasmodium falciparum HB3]|uniref:MI domain-containing protein n=1 Tax=Plasmodium falciparum (isolate HB3) TaxID=137071 RepID=A0A0L7KEI9_PLAFX|nr:hypothetical protein PFHG_03457 [Plasmodium falciparum HB3]
MKKGHNLSRKEIRKLARKQIKKNKLLYSKKKRKNSFLKKEKKQVSFSNNDQIIINKNHESNTNQFLSDSDKNLIKKNKSVKNSKKTKKIKLNDNSNKSFNYFNNKRNYLEEQEKDDYLLSYLSKKLKIKNEDGSNKKNEDKLIKELEKDGFDTSLLKLADIIFNESQNFLTKKKIQKGKDDEYNEDGEYNEDDEYNEDGEYNEDDEYNVDDEYNEDDEYNVDDEYNENDEYNEDGEDNLSQDNDKVNNKNVDNILSGKENEQPYNKLQDDNIDNVKDKKEIKKKKKKDKKKKKKKKKLDKLSSDNNINNDNPIVEIKQKKKKKVSFNYENDIKKMEKFLMSSLNKTSEFNIKSIIDDICKYFHDIDNVKLKLCYNDILIKQISPYFKNVNTTDIHICMCVVIICVLNNLLCENILYDFLKDLTAIFKYYYEDNVNLMKIVERENEMNNKIETQSINSVNDTYLLNRKNENNMLSNPQGDNYKISPKEHEKYQDFKILFRNLLKCFSLFYALSYIEFDSIIDIINILCEHMSINNVDNIIIVLKICGMKLKEEDDNIHLKHISEYLKKQIEQYIECNNILLEKSKLRFLIKDIEDLENGKMKFHFLNKFEFLFSVLKEYENKYVYKKTMISFSFIKVFNTISVENMHDEKKRGKQKNKNKNKNICNHLHTNISNNQFHDIENKTKINKLNYLIDQEQFNEVHFNKLLKKYKIQGILPKKIFLIIKYSLDVDECVHNLLALLKKKKNIPHVIQTIIQIILYNKNYKESYAKLLSNLSHVNNRVYTFSLKTIFINYIKNISNMDIKNVLFLSKLFTYLLKEKLINFLIFKHIKIEEMKNQEKTNDEINQDTNANSNIFFFLKTIFILISLDDHKENKLKNKNVWTNILHILYNQKLSTSLIYSFKNIIKKYIFDEVKNIHKVYPKFNMKYIDHFYKFLEKIQILQ